MRGHGLHNIGNCDDTGFLNDFIAFEPVGVAIAIEAFVVLVNGLWNRPWRANGLEDVIAHLGVKPDQAHLKFGEFTGFVEYLSGHLDFANVMHQARQAHAVSTFLG